MDSLLLDLLADQGPVWELVDGDLIEVGCSHSDLRCSTHLPTQKSHFSEVVYIPQGFAKVGVGGFVI